MTWNWWFSKKSGYSPRAASVYFPWAFVLCYPFWDFVKFDLFSLFLISVFKFSRFQRYLPFFISHTFTHFQFIFIFSLMYTHLHSFTLIYTHLHSNECKFTLIYTHLHSFTLIYTHLHFLVKRGNAYCTHNNDRSTRDLFGQLRARAGARGAVPTGRG
jgi:hypothetical protein